MPRTPLKTRLHRRELTIGSWLSFGYGQLAEMLAKSGFDWIVVDMEHSSTDFAQMRRLIQIIDLCDVTPLVRVGGNDPLLIKKAMDAGAEGVIVPTVNTIDDARDAIASLYYPPKGTRGVGLYRAQGFGSGFDAYRKRQADTNVLIVQVEHHIGIDNLTNILDLEDVDGFIIGPYDASASLGLPGQFDHPKVRGLMEKVEAVVRSHQKPGGFHVVQCDPEALKQRVSQGCRFLAYGTEMVMLGEKLNAEARTVLEARSLINGES